MAEAIVLYERALGGLERMLGADHPDTKSVRANLARAIAEAEAADERPARE
jgi:hypothetical protein